MAVPMKSAPSDQAIESVLAQGNLSALTPDQRTQYYVRLCGSLGLNPLTRPFEYLTLNGKLTLYARKDAADQLRKLHNISIEIVSQEAADGILTVHVRAKDDKGRTDEDLGVVAFPETLKGEVRANAILKCVTKAKRRATLSISGLGFLDETEVEDIPASARRPSAPAPNVMLAPPHDAETGEIVDPPAAETNAPDAAVTRPGGIPFESMAREAAQRGRDVFNAYYKNCTREQKATLRGMKIELESLFPANVAIDEAEI